PAAAAGRRGHFAHPGLLRAAPPAHAGDEHSAAGVVLLMDETPREKVVKGTVASPRLDAVGSLGFGLSRTRMARVVRAERVAVNSRVEPDPAAPEREVDCICWACRGAASV